jgi:hypothetical protein
MYNVSEGVPAGKRSFEDPGVFEEIILKWTLKK